MSSNEHDKLALITGGTDGIGKEIARGLAQSGIEVAIIGRDAEKGKRAEQELRRSTRNPRVHFHRADLSLASECRRLGDEVKSEWPVLRYLVHSAGIIRGRRELTAEGIEVNFATNYLSRYALTRHLLPLLSAAGEAGARIVIVSGAARGGKIYFDDVNLAAKFSLLRAIPQFCRANDLFTLELGRRLQADHQTRGVTVACFKVGVVKTGIRRGFPTWMKLLVPLVFDPLLAQAPQDAAAAALKLVLEDAHSGSGSGALFLKIRRLKRLDPATEGLSLEEARRLWSLSERLAFGPPHAELP